MGGGETSLIGQREESRDAGRRERKRRAIPSRSTFTIREKLLYLMSTQLSLPEAESSSTLGAHWVRDGRSIGGGVADFGEKDPALLGPWITPSVPFRKTFSPKKEG